MSKPICYLSTDAIDGTDKSYFRIFYLHSEPQSAKKGGEKEKFGFRYKQDFEFDLKKVYDKSGNVGAVPRPASSSPQEVQPLEVSWLAEASEPSIDDFLNARIPFIVEFCYLG